MEQRFGKQVDSLVRGCIRGTALGDSWGIAYENSTYEQLLLVRTVWLEQAQQAAASASSSRGASSCNNTGSNFGLSVNNNVVGADGSIATNRRAAEPVANASDDDRGLSMLGGNNSFLASQGAPGSNNNNNNNATLGGRSKTDDDGCETPKNQPLPAPPALVPPRPSGLGLFDCARVPASHPFIPPDFVPSSWTDDTQLTLAMARALKSSLVSDSDAESIGKSDSGIGGGGSNGKGGAAAAASAAGGTAASGASPRGGLRRGRREESGGGSNGGGDNKKHADNAAMEADDNAAAAAAAAAAEESTAKRIFFFHIAREHVKEVQRTTAGWGGTKFAVARLVVPVEETRAALQRAASKEEYQRILRGFSAHRNSGNLDAIGNGSLMKQTPLGIVFGVEQALQRRNSRIGAGGGGAGRSQQQRSQQLSRIFARERLVVELCRLSHGSTDAVATALVHNEMLTTLFADWFSNTVMPQSHVATSLAAKSTTAVLDAASSGMKLSASSSNSIGGGGGASANEQAGGDHALPRSPLFVAFPLARKRAEFVAALFRAALDYGIAFCAELAQEDASDDSSPLMLAPDSVAQHTLPPSAAAAAGATAGGVAATTAGGATAAGAAAAGHGPLDYSASFRKVGERLERVRDLALRLHSRHVDVETESMCEGDVFPFITAAEREQLEKEIVAVSDGGTFHCVNSVTFVWAYLATFGACASFWSRPDAVPVAVARSALLGGDADSNAAIIGGVLGSILGAETIIPFVDTAQQPGADLVEDGILSLRKTVMALLMGRVE